jgi:hypothetical protein
MSTKPVTEPQWDTNLTNVSPVTAGHKTDGFSNGEVPTAGELNTHFNFLYVWIHWLAAQLDDVVTLKQSIVDSYTGDAVALQAQLSAGSSRTITLQELRVGDKINAVRVRLRDNAGTSPHSQAQLKLYSMIDGVVTDGGAPPTPLATSAKSTGAGTKQTIAVTGLSITVASLTDYVVTITETDGAGAIDLYTCEVDIQRTAA